MNETKQRAASQAGPNKTELAKQASHYLQGTLSEELANDSPTLSHDAEQILKHHGSYQQDDRDVRKSGTKSHSFFVRTRLPGGRLNGAQFLTELDLCDRYGNGTLRATDRQGLQIHGVVKGNLRDVIRGIDAAKMTTYGACGDVVRNVMCCPAPLRDSPARHEMAVQTAEIAKHFALRSRAYYDVWLRDGESATQVGGEPEENPVYGATYLPRKFKFAFALPEDNCVDALTHDVGFVALPSLSGEIAYNVYVGGGMGLTPARTDTFAAVAQPFARIAAAEVVPLADAIVQIQREFGNRADRKRSRFKYLVADWGLERLREEVRRRYGKRLDLPEEQPIADLHDHLGWHQQDGGQWFLGVHINCGRIRDDDAMQMKSAFREIAARFNVEIRLTALQDLLICNVDDAERPAIEQILRSHGVPINEAIAAVDRLAIACPALPTCGLAITESERLLPSIQAELRTIMRELGLSDERISLRMTGCPNGCTRPYVAEVGIVGKAVDRYSLFLGGSVAGTRLAFKFREMLRPAELLQTLSTLLRAFTADRLAHERFGDYCWRLGDAGLTKVLGE